ncbi:hypothetical protein CDD83_9852 [Cordyceps sp. RAO-2017]|nr:hypothetical protein CDD83_9852 [Cordyceps sp. RAO-2017]
MVKAFDVVVLGSAVASAAGNARVFNNCPFSVTAWSVGGQISAPHNIATGRTYSEPFTRDPQSGGRAIKITLRPDGLLRGDPETDFAYNLDGNTIWYDLSDVMGDPFKGHRLVEASSNPSCPRIVWENGIPPAGSQVKNCQADADVTLTLCA